MLRRRDELVWLDAQAKSHEVAQCVLMLPEYSQAKVIMVYLPIRNEIDTQAIIRTAWQQGKKVVVPICQTSDKSLVLSELWSMEELSPGTMQIPEPKDMLVRPVSPDVVDLVLLPGVAFDVAGRRLGYGGGYFDRFLTRLRPDSLKIALAYEFQVLQFLPAEEHDMPVDIIVTEESVRRIKKPA